MDLFLSANFVKVRVTNTAGGGIKVDPVSALHSRVSVPVLTGPEPDDEQLQSIFRSALRAADHGLLRPWRFLVVRSQAREKLGDLFAEATLTDDPNVSAGKLDRVRAKLLRAPMLVVAIASVIEEHKVPEVEQIISAGAAVQNMLNAAYMINIGAMWRTGSMAYHKIVKQGLGLTANERIVGFLYLGQVSGRSKEVPELNVMDYFSEWN